MKNKSVIVIVGNETDPLLPSFEAAAAAHCLPILRLYSCQLGEAQINLNDQEFVVEGRCVHGILFRAGPQDLFGQQFTQVDRAFSHAEIGSTWLAALNLPSILSINRYDAGAWFQSGWSLWSRRLRNEGIAISPMAIGHAEDPPLAVWLPYQEYDFQPLPGKISRRMLGCAMPINRPSTRLKRDIL